MKKNRSVAIALAVLTAFLSSKLFYAANSSNIQIIPVSNGATGPESLAFDPDGHGPYTGISDGRILRWAGPENGWLDHAFLTPPHLVKECKGSTNPEKEHICGRPLGLQFNKNSRKLYIADAYFGLMEVEAGHKFAVPVVTHVQGHKLMFTNALDIDQESGVIYFTDSSMHFQRREHTKVVMTGDKSGRIIRYDPKNKDVQVLLSNLFFPNGIMLSSDCSFLIFAESTTCRVYKYKLGQNNTRYEVLADLPGFPDNIKRSHRGGFWVAIVPRRSELSRKVVSFTTWLRESSSFNFLPFRVQSLLSKWTGSEVIGLRISEDGEILEALEDFGGRGLAMNISEVEEQNANLWIGSVSMPFVSVGKIF